MNVSATNTDLPGVELARAIRRNIVAGALGCMYGMIVLNFYQAGFARKLGLSDVEFGYMSAIPLLVFPCRLLGSYIVEHLGRRKNWFTVTVISSRLVFVPVLLLPFVLTSPSLFRSHLFLVLLLSANALGVMGEPAWFSWMGDLIPGHMRARFWSRRSVYVTISAIIPVVFLSMMKDTMADGTLESEYHGFALVFGCAVLAGVADIIIHYRIPEPPMAKHEKAPNPLKLLALPAKDPRFRPYLVFTGVWTFSVTILGQFGNRYMLEVYGAHAFTLDLGVFSVTIGEFTLVALMTMLHISAAIAGYSIWGLLADRYGSKPVLQLCTLLVAFLPLPWIFVRPHQSLMANLIPSLVIFLFGGLTWTGVEVSTTSIVYGLSPRQSRSMYIAMSLTVAGLCGALAPTLSGYFMKYMAGKEFLALNGYQCLCVLTALGRLYSRTLLYRVEAGETRISASWLFRRIIEANPFTVFPSVYALASPATEDEKIQAVRGLGLSKSKLALTDMIAHLDDPSPKVREEAVVAIVKLGDVAGLNALIERLPQHELGLDSYAAMAIDEAGALPALHPLIDALGKMGMDPSSAQAMSMIDDTRTVQPLIDSLSHPDPRVRATAAETLGDIGDRRASEPLSRLLQTEKSALAIGSYATALSALGEISAIWQILPVLRNTRSIANRRQLAVAIGNLLGEPKVFYNYLDEECKVFGQRAGKIASHCRRLVARSEDGSVASRRADLLALLEAAETAYVGQDWQSCAAGIGRIMDIFTDAIFASMKAAGKIPEDIDIDSLDVLEKVFIITADDQRLGIQLWYSAVLTAERDPEFAKLTFEGCLLDAYVMELVAGRMMSQG